jgi:hypothetical protein
MHAKSAHEDNTTNAMCTKILGISLDSSREKHRLECQTTVEGTFELQQRHRKPIDLFFRV